MNKRLILLIVLMTCYMTAAVGQADDTVPGFSVAEGKLTVPQVRLPDGRLLSVVLVLKDDTFKVDPDSTPQFLPDAQQTEATPIVNNTWTEVGFSRVNVVWGGGTLTGSAKLEFEPGVLPICLKLKSFTFLNAQVPVNGSGSSNDGDATYLVEDDSTVTFSRDQISWDIKQQIQDMSTEYGQGRVNGAITYVLRGGSTPTFTFDGPAGTLIAFPEGQTEQVSNVTVSFKTIQEVGNKISYVIELEGEHNSPGFPAQDFMYTMPVSLDSEDPFDAAYWNTAGGYLGFDF